MSNGQPLPPGFAAEFEAISKEFTLGLSRAGGFKLFATALGEALLLVVGTVLGWFFRYGAKIIAFLAKIVLKAEQSGDPDMAEIANIAVEDLFNVRVGSGAFQGRGGASARRGSAEQIGNTIIRGLFSGVGTGAGGTLSPSQDPAGKYVGTVLGLAIEGWYQGWVAELASFGQLETFGELDDIIAQVLGLGRLTRRVLGPYVDAYVTTPLQWQINLAHRHELLPPAQAVRQFLRGRPNWGRAQLDQELGRQGYSPERIEGLINAGKKHLGVSDLGFLVRNRLWTKEAAHQHLRDQGYDDAVAQTLLTIEEQQRIEAIKNSALTAAVSGYVDGRLTSGQLRGTLDALQLPVREAEMTMIAAGTRREMTRAQLSIGQTEEAVKRGILSVPDFRERLRLAGYTGRDITTLELLLLSDIRDREQARRERVEREQQRLRQRDEDRRAREQAKVARAREQDEARRRQAEDQEARATALEEELARIAAEEARATAEIHERIDAERLAERLSARDAALQQFAATERAELAGLEASHARLAEIRRAADERQALLSRQADDDLRALRDDVDQDRQAGRISDRDARDQLRWLQERRDIEQQRIERAQRERIQDAFDATTTALDEAREAAIEKLKRQIEEARLRLDISDRDAAEQLRRLDERRQAEIAQSLALRARALDARQAAQRAAVDIGEREQVEQQRAETDRARLEGRISDRAASVETARQQALADARREQQGRAALTAARDAARSRVLEARRASRRRAVQEGSGS